jgi:hypothetical protein
MIGILINVLVQVVVSLLMTLDLGLELEIMVIIWVGSVLIMRVVVNVKHLNPVVVVYPQMIVMIIAIVCSHLMEPLIVVSVFPGNKREGHVDLAAVVETRTRSIKNNATLHVNVDLEHVNKNKPLIQSLYQQIQTPVKPLMIVMEVLTIAYGTPTDHQTAVPVYPGNKQEDHVARAAVVETLTRDIKNNATLHANVDLEHVNKKVQVTDNPQ